MTVGDQVRAAVIAVALVAHGIYALPLPPRVTERSLKEEWRQRDIELWRGWLSDAGVEVTHQQIEEQLMYWTGLTGSVHQTLKAPFAPLFQLTSSNQAWALFAAATTKPETVVVEVREDGGPWRAVSRRLDPDATWMDDTLRYRRVRGIWDGQKKRARRTYRNLTGWVADRTFEQMPEVSEVRVYLEQGRSVYPWEEPDPKLVMRHLRRHVRDEAEDPAAPDSPDETEGETSSRSEAPEAERSEAVEASRGRAEVAGETSSRSEAPEAERQRGQSRPDNAGEAP